MINKYEIDIISLLRKEKEEYHLSLRSLAKKTRVSLATVSRLLKHPERDFSFETYKKVAEYFGKVIPTRPDNEPMIKDLTVKEFTCLMREILNNNIKEEQTIMTNYKIDFHGFRRSDKNYSLHIGMLPERKNPCLYVIKDEGSGTTAYPLAFFKGLDESLEAIKILDELIQPEKGEHS